MINFIGELASAIATGEGFFNPDPNVAPRRNHNPGDLIDPHTGHFRVFVSNQAGIAALYHQIALDISRGLTLEQFMYKYAPPNENNTRNYLNETIRRLGGINPKEPMWNFLDVVYLK